MYQALYRKWRPRTFDDVVGQAHITETLKKQVETGRLSHAYLFTGTRGTGKTSCAKILARAVNCEHPVNGNPCNKCAACRGIEDGSVMDVVELDAASNNGVDSVRALRDEAIFTPASVKKRVYIIDEVHMLSSSAFNALLKILEEPPEHLMFILCTTELRKVLPTIVSRCQRHSFKRLSPEDIAGRLKYVAAEEHMDLTDGAAELLSRLADGGMRDGLSLLDQCSAAEHIDEAAVLSAMGLSGSRRTADLLDAVCARNTEKALTLFDGLWNDGKDPAAVLNELAGLMRDVLLTKVAPNGCAGLISGVYAMNTLRDFSSRLTAEELSADMESIRASDLGGSSPRRSAELCLIGLCSPALSDSLPELRARVARLEQLVQGGAAVPAAARVLDRVSKGSKSPTSAQSSEDQSKDSATSLRNMEVMSELIPTSQQEPEPVHKPVSVSESGDRAGSNSPHTPAEAPAPPADGEFWKSLLTHLRGTLDIGTYSLVSGPNIAGELSGGTLTISFGDNPFIKGILESGGVSSVLREQASALAGHPIELSLAARGAAAVEPDMGKLGELSQFSNFKFE